MDFRGKTAEEVFATVKEFAEGTDWEYKGKQLLGKDKHELRKDLGKQVSAFANSGGGQILLGINQDKKTKQLELQPFDLYRNRQPFNEYLSNLIEQAVDYPVQTCEVIPCKSLNDPDIGICVVDVKDSPSAPHMAKDHEKYFWRRDSNSEPAPHFHLELLRHREQKTVLDVVSCELVVHRVIAQERHADIHAVLGVTVQNQSLQICREWGLHIKSLNPESRWHIWRHDEIPHDGWYWSSGEDALFGTQTTIASVDLTIKIGFKPFHLEIEREKAEAFQSLALVIRPISENYLSREHLFPPDDPQQKNKMVIQFQQQYDERVRRGQLHKEEMLQKRKDIRYPDTNDFRR